jgi:subtilisin family serine protease
MKFFASLLLSLLLMLSSAAQTQKAPDRWFNLDYAQDHVAGVSSDKAIKELLANKKAQDVIIAVIDGGTDPLHEDLKSNIWVNQREIPGNGIDDDNNGYIDDINGWDFIGGKNGTVEYDNMELTRIYRDLKKKYDNVEEKNIAADKKEEYKLYLKVKTDFTKKYTKAKTNYEFYYNIAKSIRALKKEIGKDKLTNEDLASFKTDNPECALALNVMHNIISNGGKIQDMDLDNELKEGIEHFEVEYKYQLNLDYDPRARLVGDNYLNINEHNYGNNDVKGPDATHGTHVAGIIGAIRDNGIGMDGICNHVKIMIVRCVPNGDERDKDVANAIHYAVDNGAKIINMSFGKDYGTNKAAVDEAVKYAMNRDVLIVHAAGNEGSNLKGKPHFPSRVYADRSGQANAWIEVGASQPDMQPASFSNYGKKEVDLFAPGTDIYSTTPNNTYKVLQGTSMASPVVAGCAALLRAYYPDLTAEQVKLILLKSVTKVSGKMVMPVDDEKKEKADEAHKTLKPGKIKYKKLCNSGGIINVYNAVKMAEAMHPSK